MNPKSPRAVPRLCGAVLTVVAAAALAGHQTPGVAISISNLQPLAFGKFAAGSGGTVTVAPGGARSATGDVVLLSSGGGSAASFRISGDPELTYDLALPANGAVSLANGTGQTMPITNFTSSPAAPGQLDLSGFRNVLIGATLNVGPDQAQGSYAGSFDVTVDYN